MLETLEVGGYLQATLLGGLEIHIERDGMGGIQAVVYGGVYSADLRDWQAKGAYRVRNPGMSDEEVSRLADELFDAHENNLGQRGQIAQPVFDYDRRLSQPVYRGARLVHQRIGPFQYSSMLGQAFEAVGLSEGTGNAIEWGVGFSSLGWAPTLSLVVFGTDTIASVYATYQEPRQYYVGWESIHHPDINPNIPLERLR